jgi:hypothetical protein
MLQYTLQWKWLSCCYDLYSICRHLRLRFLPNYICFFARYWKSLITYSSSRYLVVTILKWKTTVTMNYINCVLLDIYFLVSFCIKRAWRHQRGNQKPWTLSLATASRVHLFCNLQSWARTHAVLVIGLYELLYPTTSLIEPPGPPNWYDKLIFI